MYVATPTGWFVTLLHLNNAFLLLLLLGIRSLLGLVDMPVLCDDGWAYWWPLCLCKASLLYSAFFLSLTTGSRFTLFRELDWFSSSHLCFSYFSLDLRCPGVTL